MDRTKLCVKTFGGFSMSYGKKTLLGKSRGDSQFVSMMQILLHNKEKGVRREKLEEILFEDREVLDLNHALHSVIYNAKKKFEKAGLPKVNYIEIKNGVVKWTNEIPVREDAHEFERLYQKIQTEKDINKKLQLLKAALSVYTGEFIPNRASVLWVALEASRYRDMFEDCVNIAAGLFREKKEFDRLERLGIYASNVEPFEEWETLTMEAMVSLGRYEEATDLYAKTVDSYFEERGLRPSQKLMDVLQDLGGQVVHSRELLDTIQKQLNEPEEKKQKGAYLCSYPIFMGIYQHMVRMLRRSGQSVYLMLCTIVDSKGNPMKEGHQLDAISLRLEEAICQSIRESDVVNKYSKGQYLVLLINTSRENCNVIQKRINYKFLTGRQRTGVRYYVNSVLMEKDF